MKTEGINCLSKVMNSKSSCAHVWTRSGLFDHPSFSSSQHSCRQNLSCLSSYEYRTKRRFVWNRSPVTLSRFRILRSARPSNTDLPKCFVQVPEVSQKQKIQQQRGKVWRKTWNVQTYPSWVRIQNLFRFPRYAMTSQHFRWVEDYGPNCYYPLSTSQTSAGLHRSYIVAILRSPRSGSGGKFQVFRTAQDHKLSTFPQQ